MKKETGQSKYTAPQMITENQKNNTSHADMAAARNRLYLQKIRKILSVMETTSTDRLDHYEKVVGKVVGKVNSPFTFKQVSMAQLHSTLQHMKATGSTGEDDISTRLLKQASNELEPLLLQLVNVTIKTTKYPDALKTTKVVPIEKAGKEKTTSDRW